MWAQTGGTDVTLTGSDTEAATFTAPASDGELVFTLTVTGRGVDVDDNSYTHSAEAQVFVGRQPLTEDVVPEPVFYMPSHGTLWNNTSWNGTYLEWRAHSGLRNSSTPYFYEVQVRTRDRHSWSDWGAIEALHSSAPRVWYKATFASCTDHHYRVRTVLTLETGTYFTDWREVYGPLYRPSRAPGLLPFSHDRTRDSIEEGTTDADGNTDYTATLHWERPWFITCLTDILIQKSEYLTNGHWGGWSNVATVDKNQTSYDITLTDIAPSGAVRFSISIGNVHGYGDDYRAMFSRGIRLRSSRLDVHEIYPLDDLD